MNKKIKSECSEKQINNLDQFCLNVLNGQSKWDIVNELTRVFTGSDPELAFTNYFFEGTEHYKSEFEKVQEYITGVVGDIYNTTTLNGYIIYGALYHLNPTVEFCHVTEEDDPDECVMMTMRLDILGDPTEIYFLPDSFAHPLARVIVNYRGNNHSIPTLKITDAIINQFLTGDVIRATETMQ